MPALHHNLINKSKTKITKMKQFSNVYVEYVQKQYKQIKYIALVKKILATLS